jgi:signal transduction histidine kinase
MNLLVDGLAAYSIALRTGAGPFQPIGMEVVVRTAMDLLAGELHARSAEVTYGTLPSVEGNPDRLIQLFENLIRNALHHQGPEAPRVRIAAEERPEEWLFAVSDDGPGVEPEYLETIFKPFERLDVDRHCGPGLGLAVCRAIVTGHGGRIWCESSPGAGAAFLFTLPRITR